MICNECETVSYCTKHGCIPKQPAPVYVKTFHGGKPWPLHPELPPECQTEAEKRAYAFGWWKALEAQRALDKKAENARELGLDYEPATEESSAVAAPVQEPVGTYGEIHESMQALLRSGLQSDQQIYAAMKDKPLYTTPPAQPAQQEPVDFASLLHEAEEIVRAKPTWKRFIDGTPLSNDIAVWMTVFAQDFARRTSPPAQRKPLTPEQFNHMPELFVIPPHHVEMVVRTIEATHNIKENT